MLHFGGRIHLLSRCPTIEIEIRSRIGNAVLVIAGALYMISGSALLLYYVVSNWGANGLADYMLQLTLVVAILGGVFFFRIGRKNLTGTQQGPGERRSE